MMKKKTQNTFLLILTAFIWGIAFVAQSEGGDAIGPFSFNCIRSFLGSVALLPVIRFLDHKKISSAPTNPIEKRKLLIGGITCGTIMFLATNLQQFGISLGTSAGKAGFLTACYIIFVPLIGILFGRKCGLHIWIGVILSVIGLYLLCIDKNLSFELSDILILLCAVCFAIHILVIDHFAPYVDGVRLSCMQFLICGILTVLPMIFCEIGFSFESAKQWYTSFLSHEAWISLLYAGILSSGVAYTLQIIGQKEVHPTVASLLLSLESVFAVIAGWLILGQRMTHKQLVGCALIFIAITLTHLTKAKKEVS